MNEKRIKQCKHSVQLITQQRWKNTKTVKSQTTTTLDGINMASSTHQHTYLKASQKYIRLQNMHWHSCLYCSPLRLVLDLVQWYSIPAALTTWLNKWYLTISVIKYFGIWDVTTVLLFREQSLTKHKNRALLSSSMNIFKQWW